MSEADELDEDLQEKAQSAGEVGGMDGIFSTGMHVMMCACHGDHIDEDHHHDHTLKASGIDNVKDPSTPGILRWDVMSNGPGHPEISLNDDPLFLLLGE